MRVLIQGGGPAGLGLALALRQNGVTATIVEKSPSRRHAGYAVGLHVNGFAALRYLGIAEGMYRHALPLAVSRHDDAHGRKHIQYDYRDIHAHFGADMMALMRDDLLQELEAASDGIEICYDCEVEAVEDTGDGLDVQLTGGVSRRFDLLIGADGHRSALRRLCFGPDTSFVRPLGYRVAAWTTDLDKPLETSVAGVMGVDRQASLYDIGDGRAATLFCWRDPDTGRVTSADKQQIVESRFSDFNGPVKTAIASARWDEVFFDDVSVVEMPCWHKGRIALIGDAAWSMTFLSGQGTSIALAGAVVLAKMISQKGYVAGFPAFENQMRGIVTRQQEVSRKIGGQYVPQSKFGMHLQKLVLPLLFSKPVLPFTLKRMTPEEVQL